MERRRSAQWGQGWCSSLFRFQGLLGAVGTLALVVVSGCGGANEADVALITGNPVQTSSPGVPASPRASASPPPTASPTPGEPAALRFAGAQPATIGVRGSGLPEQSTLTFQVTDALGIPVGGVAVNFTLADGADESIAPTQGVTGADGNVQVVLTSGDRAVSVQITAAVDSVTPPLTVRSTAVIILGGPPSQLHFSLAHQFHNISGRVTFGLTDQITAFVGDRFGNPVPPGTAVSFTTTGGVIGNPMTTNALGQATATLVSQAPVPSNGIVSTLATTHGERPFVDANVNGVCDAPDQMLAVSEPFYDANCNGVRDEGEDFVDLNEDQSFNDDQGPGTRACTDQVVLFDSICTTFSGPTRALLTASDSGPIAAGGSRDFTLIISDNPDPIGNPGAGNPIVGGSTVSISISGARGRVLGVGEFTLPDTQTNNRIINGVNRFHFSVVDNAPTSSTAETDAVIVTVRSDPGLPAGGNGSVSLEHVMTFLGAEPTRTPTPSPTPAAEPPAIVPGNAILSAGSGAPPSGCNGGTQTFVVTGGSPPFAVFGGGGCVSVSSVPSSGGSFVFTAGNTTGSFSVIVTDSISRTAAASLTILGPPTPTVTVTLAPTLTPTPTITPTATPATVHIQVALFVNQASSNGDGTLSSVVSALVTDETGAAVGNGVPVQFSLIAPVLAGVSVTSPGLTGQAAPCTLGFPVFAQPGDALSCIKYDQARQGQTVTVQALVQTPSGPLTSTQVITLPDLRPTPTPTVTPTPSPAPTLRPSSIQFVSATPVAIGVRESGLPEQSSLTFRVTDAIGNPVAGTTVNFTLTAVDDETIHPLQVVTDRDGLARTTLSSGARASTLRVVAGADSDGNGSPDLFAQSTAVAVFGAPPIQSRFSIAAEKLNVPGRVLFGVRDPISAFVNDRFGNAVPPGTAVTFVSNGASVVNQTATDSDGVAKATLLTEQDIPPTGIVTVLAFTRGEETFHDNNGNGVFEPAIDTLEGDNLPEPFIDFRPLPVSDASCLIPPPSPFCNGSYDVGPLFELFVDDSDDGIWSTQGANGIWDNDILVFDFIPVTFSGPLVSPVASPTTFAIPNGGAQAFTIEVHDDLFNPLVGGSTITVTVNGGTVSGSPITVPDGESFNRLVDGLNRFTFVVGDAEPAEDPPQPPAAATVAVTVTSENGNGTFIVASGTID